MSERFFLTTPPSMPQATEARLEGDEARHLARVLRAKVGDEIRVFDGRGSEWTAVIRTIGRDRIDLSLGEPIASEPLGRYADTAVSIAAALPKGDRQKWMVEKLTELGVARLVPLGTDRGVAEATAAAVERLRRTVIEACKQCGRSTLMEIADPVTVEGCLAQKPADAAGLLADPAGSSAAAVLASIGGAAIALVGPEGGFTDRERAEAIAAGFTPVSLGPYILRVETAAVAIAATMAARPRRPAV